MDLQLLNETLAAQGEPRFRAGQVWRWTASGVAGYTAMTNLPRALRETLEREVPFSSLEVRSEAHARDGTVKALFATADGRPLEAVLMRYRSPPGGGGPPGGSGGRRRSPPGGGSPPGGAGGRRSICLSSQSGCPLTCTFCATGKMRFARNLSTSEILDQALHFRRVDRVNHCVFMGMGEPMLNLDNVLAACERLPDLGISHRHTAISTVGWIPGIERLAECEMPLRLALSLHAAEEALRSELMPVNERYPLSEVIEACRAFYERKRRRIFVEYVMLAGVNDRYEQAVALAKLLAPTYRRSQLTPGTPVAGARKQGNRTPDEGGDVRDPQMFKVNLIPYNPIGGRPAPHARPASGTGMVDQGDRYQGSSREAIEAFRSALQERGVEATVRLTRGREIDAACGQLAASAA
jgi:23S rRNA (adenine2503-C2)-methyltransferase